MTHERSADEARSNPPSTSTGPPTGPAGHPTASAEVAPGAPVVLDHVSRWYGNVVAVNDISFSLLPGVTGLLGPNGAGKSTLLHLMAGLLRPSAGSVRVEDRPAWRNPEVFGRIGLVPEREAVHAFLTGREFVTMNARLQHLPNAEAAAAAAIRMVDLEAAADRLVGTYSKGMRQRVKLAGALVHEPRILLLDEPFNGMDPRQRLHLMDLLHRLGDEGRTILFSSHILEEVEQIAGSIQVMVAGRHAASGGFREIRRLMTERPHQYTIRSADDRALASAIIADASASSVQLVTMRDATRALHVEATDFSSFVRVLPQIAGRCGIRLYEVSPADESLESVFSYLVTRETR